MAQTPVIDPNILEKAASGDPQAFEIILHAFEAPIFRHVYRFIRHRQDAEDITQDIFIKAYKHLRTFDPHKKFSAWLYAIATNAVYDWLRKKKRSQELLILDEEDAPETIDDSVSYKDIEVRQDISAALEQIRPIYKAVLLLFYADGFQYEEIAGVLDLPLNTVKTYLHRGKRDLKKILWIH